VNGRHDDGSEVGLDRDTAVLADPELPSEQGLGGGSAEADEHLWLQQRELGVEPRAAGRDLRGVRLLVDPPFAAGLPLEVLDDIGDVGQLAVDPGLLQGLVE